MSFSEIIKSRRSTRKFTEQPIDPNKIKLLEKCALLSPTGKRKNHWDFIFVENSNTLSQLAKSKTHGSILIEGAKLAVVVIGDPTVSDTWIEDCSIAAIMLQLQAEDLGLGSCWVQINKRAHSVDQSSENFVKETLSIPSEKGVLSIIAIGHPEKRRAPIKESELLREKIHFEKYSN